MIPRKLLTTFSSADNSDLQYQEKNCLSNIEEKQERACRLVKSDPERSVRLKCPRNVIIATLINMPKKSQLSCTRICSYL